MQLTPLVSTNLTNIRFCNIFRFIPDFLQSSSIHFLPLFRLSLTTAHLISIVLFPPTILPCFIFFPLSSSFISPYSFICGAPSPQSTALSASPIRPSFLPPPAQLIIRLSPTPSFFLLLPHTFVVRITYSTEQILEICTNHYIRYLYILTYLLSENEIIINIAIVLWNENQIFPLPGYSYFFFVRFPPKYISYLASFHHISIGD